MPAPLFDTQVAAMVCGYGDQVSYSELVQSVCKVTLDKSSRFTDWARRPLSDAQIAYAIADVTYLRDIYRYLHTGSSARAGCIWLEDEMRTLTSPSTYEQHPENAWERLKHRARKPRDLAVLMELAAWREREAQARDVPRSRVLKDDVLIELALAAPRDSEALGNLRALSARDGTLARRRGNPGRDRTRARARPQNLPSSSASGATAPMSARRSNC